MAVFANILKTLRTDKHLSQQELATRLGISKSAVSMYEQGRREPDFDILNKIADIFQVDADYLLGRSSLSHMNPNLSRLPHTLIPLTLRRLSWMMLKNTFNLSVQKKTIKEHSETAMLNKYEELLEEAAAQNISVDENFPFHGNLKGLYVDQKYRPLN